MALKLFFLGRSKSKWTDRFVPKTTRILVQSTVLGLCKVRRRFLVLTRSSGCFPMAHQGMVGPAPRCRAATSPPRRWVAASSSRSSTLVGFCSPRHRHRRHRRCLVGALMARHDIRQQNVSISEPQTRPASASPQTSPPAMQAKRRRPGALCSW